MLKSFTKKDLKKVLKNKLVQAGVLIVGAGFILANFWSIVGYGLLGAVVVVGGLFAYGMYEGYKENAENADAKKD